MALGTTNISTTLVANTIGLGSNDVGTLIAKAKTGGTGGYAYSIIENGGTINAGELITGAKPHHNIYSAHSPAHWFLQDTGVTNPTVFDIKNKLNYSFDGTRYAFNLGDFRQYNHEAVQPSNLASINGVSPTTTIDIGYVGNLSNSFRIYPEMGELNWSTMFSNAGMSWLTDPYLGIYSIKKNSSTEINITNESESGSLSLSQAHGLDGGSYISALFDTTGFTVGSIPIAVKVGIGNTSTKSNLFGLNLLNLDLNLVVKERPKLDASPIIIFYDDYDATLFSYTMSQYNLFPATDTIWDTEIPPYSGVRYSITSGLHVIAASVSLSFYVCKGFMEPTNDALQTAITNGTAVKIKNVATYPYQGTTPYSISMNGTLGFATITDETLYVIAYVEAYTE